MDTQWFDIVEGRELQQGDILPNCPVYVIPSVSHPIKDGDECSVELVTYDLIVMTQSCDLVENQKADVRQVILCSSPLLSDVQKKEGHALAKSDNRKNLIKFSLVGLHPLKEFSAEEVSRQFSVVHFSQAFSLPLTYVRDFAGSLGKRLRLRSPYRELLAQRYANFYCRVALPDTLELPKSE